MSKSAVQVAREAQAAGRAALPEFSSRTSFALLMLRQVLRTDYRGVVITVAQRVNSDASSG